MDTKQPIVAGNGSGEPGYQVPALPGSMAEPGDAAGIELPDYWRMITRRRRIILAVFAGVLGAACLYLLVTPRVYQATAKVQVLQPQVPPTMLLLSEASRTPEASLKTQAKIIQSSIIANRTSTYLSDLASGKADAARGDARLLKEQLSALGNPSISAAEISRHLKVGVEEPDVLAISVTSTDPRRAAVIANAVQAAYLQDNEDRAGTESMRVLSFLDEQLPRVEKELRDAEAEIKQFKARFNIQDMDSVATLKLRQAYEYLADAERAQAELQSAEAELKSLRTRLAAEPQVRTSKRLVNDPVAEGLRQEMARVEVELGSARSRYEESHPQVQTLKDRLEELEAQYSARFGESRTSLRVEDVPEPNPAYEVLKERVREQESRVASIKARLEVVQALAGQKESSLPNLPQAYVELARLEQTKEIRQKAYAELLSRYQDAQLGKARTIGAARIVDIASVPQSPIRPRVMHTLLLATILGLAGGLSLALLLEQVDTSVKDPDELMLRTGLSALGFVPLGRGRQALPDVALRLPRAPISESFRSIRSNLRFASLDSPLRALMVTGAGASEGKTFTATNLAIVFAQMGTRTILVDCDMRRPAVHRAFDFHHAPGLSDVLAQEVNLDEALHGTELSSLHVLASGTIPPNPAELLESQRMANLLEQLKERADLVILDTPPTLVVTDAVILSGQVDGCIVVLQQGRVATRAVQEVCRLLEQGRGRIIGAIINKVRMAAGDYYSHYYYGYYLTQGDHKRERRPRRSLPG